MRPDATEVGDARRRVEQLLAELPGEADQLSFDQPWELRAFAMAVAAYNAGQYGWSEFQLALINAIRRWEGGEGDAPWSYYDHWLEALETVLAGSGLLSESELDERTREILDLPPTTNHHEAHPDPVAIDPAK